MPSSVVQAFSDPDDYAAAIKHTTSEVTVTGRGRFEAKLVAVDFRRMLFRRLHDTLPRVSHTAYIGGYASFQFLTQPGPRALADGLEYASGKLVRHIVSASYHQHTSGPIHFGGISLPLEEMAMISTMAGIDLTPPRDTIMVAPAPTAMARLLRSHDAVAHLAETAPEIIANPSAAEGLEQTLIDALAGCLDEPEAPTNSQALQQHAIVMRRFRRILEENPDRPLYIPEICRAIGGSDSTLRVCCNEHLGMGPRRYLTIRRLHLARRALRDAAPGASNVTDIATRYGFWHLARFAGEYKSLFGESPSATLQR